MFQTPCILREQPEYILDDDLLSDILPPLPSLRQKFPELLLPLQSHSFRQPSPVLWRLFIFRR
jgi:hypothetical protein